MLRNIRFNLKRHLKIASWEWNAPSRFISTIDLHAGGEPARVVLDGNSLGCIQGSTMAEKRISLMRDHDHIRKLLLLEPRGYPCQNANVIFPSKLSTSGFGYVIMEQNKIYPMMSGHNTICVATALLKAGIIPMPVASKGTSIVTFSLESPGGLVDISADCIDGKVRQITLQNVPSFVSHHNIVVDVPYIGPVTVSIAYSGMWYCIVDAHSVDISKSPYLKRMQMMSNEPAELSLTPNAGHLICKVGEMIKAACRDQFPVTHPEFDYSGVDILVFCGKPGDVHTAGSHSRNTVVMSKGPFDWNDSNTWTGMLDRSPCGTGTAAVMALLYLRGLLNVGEPFIHESIIGTQFTGMIRSCSKVGAFDAIVPEISGRAFVTQHCDIVIDPDDPFPHGFTVGDIW